PGEELKGGFAHCPLAAPDPAHHPRADEMNSSFENIGDHRPGGEHLGAISAENEQQLPLAYLGIQQSHDTTSHKPFVQMSRACRRSAARGHRELEGDTTGAWGAFCRHIDEPICAGLTTFNFSPLADRARAGSHRPCGATAATSHPSSC